jgi:hypothetical protein
MNAIPLSPRRNFLGLLLSLPVLLVLGGPVMASYGVNVQRSSKDPRWVEGAVSVPVSPGVAWAKLSAVKDWATIFHDITSLKVRKQVEGRWELSVVSSILGGHAHNYEVELVGSNQIKLKMNLTGVDVRGSFKLAPEGENKTSARFELFAATTGVAGWFVSEKTLRQKQETLVASYLQDFAKACGAAP